MSACPRSATVRSLLPLGITPVPLHITATISDGPSRFEVVGLRGGAGLRETHLRVTSALSALGVSLPAQAQTVTVVVTVKATTPAVPFATTALDLPIALAILGALGSLPAERLADVMAYAELGLDGTLRPVRGAILAAEVAAASDSSVIVAPANAAEANAIPTARVTSSPTLSMLRLLFADPRGLPAQIGQPQGGPVADLAPLDMADVIGNPRAVRALEIAAAGGHAALLEGPPGAGCTMLARRLPTILPPMTPDEARPSLALRSVAGLLSPDEARTTPTARPFRAPHHTISTAGLIGGGSVPRPGEVSLAHQGVLFLDELSLFPRHTLKTLTPVLESSVPHLLTPSNLVCFGVVGA